MSDPYAAPASDLDTGSAGFSELPRLSAWWVALFTFATLGLYMLLWLYQCTSGLRRLLPDRPITPALYVGVPLIWVGSFATEIADAYFALGLAGESVWSSLSLASSLLATLWSFSVRNRLIYLCRHLRPDYHVGGFMTLFFSPYYLAYKVNEARRLDGESRSLAASLEPTPVPFTTPSANGGTEHDRPGTAP